MKFVKILKILRGATPLRLYGLSSPKGDITCPRVHGTFPQNLVQIDSYLLFFSSYAKFANFAKKTDILFFYSEMDKNLQKPKSHYPNEFLMRKKNFEPEK